MQLIAQATQLLNALRQIPLGHLRGDAHAGDGGDILRAGAAAVLLPAAFEQRQDAHALAHKQRGGSLRPVELIRGQAQRIDAERSDINRDVADRSDGVRVAQCAVLMRNRIRTWPGVREVATSFSLKEVKLAEVLPIF